MQGQRQQWTARWVVAVVRMLLLFLVSAGITVAVFVVDENKPIWVLVAAPAATAFFGWLLYRMIKPSNGDARRETPARLQEVGMATELYELLEQRRDLESEQKGLRGKLKATSAAILGKPVQNQERMFNERLSELRLHDHDAADRIVWPCEGNQGVLLANLHALIRLRRDYPGDETTAVALNQSEQTMLDVWELDDLFVDLIARRHVAADEMRQLERSVEALRLIGVDKAIAIMSEAMPFFSKMTEPEKGYSEEYSKLLDDLVDLYEKLVDCDEDTLAHLYDYVMARKADFASVRTSRAAVAQSSGSQGPFLPV